MIASAKKEIQPAKDCLEKKIAETPTLTKIYADFKESPQAEFIKSLRQYMQHYQSPPIAMFANLTDSREQLKGHVVIPKNVLNEYSKWTSKAKKFISNLKDSVDIRDVSSEYYQLVFDFHCWYEKRLTGIFQLEFQELQELRNAAEKEDLKLIIQQFLVSDTLTNDTFFQLITRFFDKEPRGFLDRSPQVLKIGLIIDMLKKFGYLATPEHERIIREKLTY